VAERTASRRDTVAFLVCLALAVVARVAPLDVQDSVSAVVRATVLAPLLSLESQIILLKTSRLRLRHVVAERDSAVTEAMAVYALREENDELRQLLDLSRRTQIQHVSAEILHQAGQMQGRTFLLTVGRKHGVAPGDPVVAPRGLLGVIRNVDASTSVAVAWPHPDFRVSAQTADGTVFGIIAALGTEGPNTILLELRGVPYGDVVRPGTVVVTSGLGGEGGVYPRGIPIGTVLDVADERLGWSRTYRVRALVHPASVSQVLVLTRRAATGEAVEAARE